MIQKKRWYIIQTYSGYENSVKDDLMRRVDSMGMNDFIFSVVVFSFVSVVAVMHI